MRLIDADALIADIRKNSSSYFADDFAREWVDKQPTVEPSAGWISVEDRLPEINTHVLISRKEWPYPTPDDGDRVFKGMRHKDPRSGKIIWWCYGPGQMNDEEVWAWRELPKPYELKEDKQ